jgi:hypothetical protein
MVESHLVETADAGHWELADAMGATGLRALARDAARGRQRNARDVLRSGKDMLRRRE